MFQCWIVVRNILIISFLFFVCFTCTSVFLYLTSIHTLYVYTKNLQKITGTQLIDLARELEVSCKASSQNYFKQSFERNPREGGIKNK